MVVRCCYIGMESQYGVFFFFKQKTAYEMRISDWSSDVCSSDLTAQDILRAWRIYWGSMAKAAAAAALMGAEVQRIDKYLWFARLAKNRSVAQDMAETG